MFARFFAVASLAALAVATPLALRDGQCNTGNIQCCSGSTSATSYNAASQILGLAPLVGQVVGAVGLDCSPITAVGTGGGATCNQQPMCCSNNKMNGVVNVGCSPMSLRL
ncbi:hydrophobin [Suillus paluster]|uniref:hydrophobin n=1 Tax=Suillus paluster TaxID=48578 RepID=UPI001B85F332|nr:hydrophobin [Suillus paluster]KAG1733393.1 hydrophobin [Suillus paluster]